MTARLGRDAAAVARGGPPLDPDVAFVFGLVLSLAANVIAVAATAS